MAYYLQLPSEDIMLLWIYVSLKSYKSDLSIGFLSLVLLVVELFIQCPFNKPFTTIHFSVTKLDIVESINTLYIFLVFYFYNTCLNLFNISYFFSGLISISSIFFEFSSSTRIGFTFFSAMVFSIISFVASSLLWKTFFETVFEKFSFVYVAVSFKFFPRLSHRFFTIDKNLHPLADLLVLGSTQ